MSLEFQDRQGGVPVRKEGSGKAKKFWIVGDGCLLGSFIYNLLVPELYGSFCTHLQSAQKVGLSVVASKVTENMVSYKHYRGKK